MDLGAAEAYVGGKISPFSSQPLPETKGYLSNFPADSGSARYSGEVNNVDLAGYGNLTKTEVPFHQSPDLGVASARRSTPPLRISLPAPADRPRQKANPAANPRSITAISVDRTR